MTTVGLDIGDDSMRAEWEGRAHDLLTFEAGSAYSLPFDDQSFDCVCAFEVLEHLERPAEALSEMTRVAGRALLVSVPREPLWRIAHLIAARDLRDLGNTPGHINHWSSRSIRQLIAKHATVKDTRRPFPWTVVRAEVEPRRRSRPTATRKTLERVLYFGTYERDYPRNAQVISCLRRAGVEVTEHHVPVWEDMKHKFGVGAGAVARLGVGELRLLRRPLTDYDVMIVGYPGHFDMPRARRVAGDRPVVFNPLLSLYDSLVSDRGRWGEKSLPARILEGIDRRALRLADLVIADTEAHAEYFAQLGGIPRERIEVCFLGAEEPPFGPGWHRDESFHCLFYGKMIPLHGLDTILAAAALTPEISFRIAGAGQLEGVLRGSLPENVEWVGWVAHENIPGELHAAGCALGIFGTTDKARRVIPNKAFEALACGTPLITADTPASRELLEDGANALLVPPGDAVALSAAVRRLASDDKLAERLGAAGHEVYRARASEDVLGARWREILEGLV